MAVYAGTDARHSRHAPLSQTRLELKSALYAEVQTSCEL
jgi:hypothetical protein